MGRNQSVLPPKFRAKRSLIYAYIGAHRRGLISFMPFFSEYYGLPSHIFSMRFHQPRTLWRKGTCYSSHRLYFNIYCRVCQSVFKNIICLSFVDISAVADSIYSTVRLSSIYCRLGGNSIYRRWQINVNASSICASHEGMQYSNFTHTLYCPEMTLPIMRIWLRREPEKRMGL